jgi:hypothetical protein
MPQTNDYDAPDDVLSQPKSSRLPAPPNAANDKKVKLNRRKSIFRDARFKRDCHALKRADEAPVTHNSSVCSEVCSEVHLSEPLRVLRHSILLSTKGSKGQDGYRRRSRISPWYERRVAPPLRAHYLPAEWRDATDILQLEYFHQALTEQGSVYCFSANLSPGIEAEAKSRPSACDWLRRRLAYHLNAGLSRTVEFFLVLEENDDRRLHIHGEFAVSEDEVKLARACLRRACGEWKTTRQHQVKTKPDPDYGWVSYIGKDLRKLTPFMRNLLKGSRQAVQFDGSAISVTRQVTRRAKELYDGDRAAVIAMRSSGRPNT